jgi:uncharacterized surface protein with fasciclin (FAS1) repeats
MKSFSSLILPLALIFSHVAFAQNVLTTIRNRGYTAFADAVEKAGLQHLIEARSYGALTVLVPQNRAFEAIQDTVASLNSIQLQYVLATHFIPSVIKYENAVPGEKVSTLNPYQDLTTIIPYRTSLVQFATSSIDLTNVTDVRDVPINSGIFHVISKVIIPTRMGSAPLVSNIADTAKAAGLTSLLAALEKASLVNTIQGAKDITVFAPTNDAFAAIKSTTDKLSVEQLKDILLLHVTPTVYYSKRLSNASVKTLNAKQNLDVKVSGGSVTVNGIRVITADVVTTQGIVHVIEKVILPPTDKKPTDKKPTDNKNYLVNSGSNLMASFGLIIPALIMAF